MLADILLGTAAALLAPQTELAERYIGGFGQYYGERRYWNWSNLVFDESEEGGLTVTLLAPFGDTAIPVTREGDRLRFALIGDGKEFTFEGEVHEDSIQGWYKWNRERGVFEVVPLFDLDEAELERRCGLYRTPAGATFSIERSGEVLRYTHFESGERRTLTVGRHGEMLAGPAFLRLYPVESTFRWEGDTVVVSNRDGGSMEGTRLRTVQRTTARVDVGDVELAVNLYECEGGGPRPGIVLVPGSGDHSYRNAYGFWPDYLAHLGFRVLTYDKRGTGASEGELSSAIRGRTGPELWGRLAADARACVEYLRQLPDVDAERVGMLGFSQAGWVMPYAAREPGVAFTIAVNGAATTVMQELAFSELAGESRKLRRLLPLDEAYAELAELEVTDYTYERDIARQETPGLWLYGMLDRVVPSRASADLIEAIADGTELDFTVARFPRGNHELFEAEFGHLAEGTTLARMVPGLFDVVEGWLRERGVL